MESKQIDRPGLWQGSKKDYKPETKYHNRLKRTYSCSGDLVSTGHKPHQLAITPVL